MALQPRKALREGYTQAFQPEALSFPEQDSIPIAMKVFENGTARIKCIWRNLLIKGLPNFLEDCISSLWKRSGGGAPGIW